MVIMKKMYFSWLAATTTEFYVVGIQSALVRRECALWYMGVCPSH
jgi:hypothetical protein